MHESSLAVGGRGISPAEVESGMKVLHVTSGNLYGGVEVMLATLARTRHRCAGMDPGFACCFDGQSARELRLTGAPVHVLGGVRTSRPWTIAAARTQLRRVLNDFGYDVALFHMPWSLALLGPAARSARRPFAFWVHGFPQRGHWLDWWAGRSRPGRTICNSAFTASRVREHPGWEVIGESIRIVHPPVAPPPHIDPSARARLRAELGADLSMAVIVQTSRLEGWKGHRLLISALATLRQTPGWTCWIAGGAQRPEEVQYMSALKASVERAGIAGRVRFLGQRGDIRELLAAADIHCQPNEGPEPFGIAYLEALAAGLPVVTTRMGAAPEIVDESCGFLVEPGDFQSLGEVLGALIASPDERKRLGAAGPRRAASIAAPEQQLVRLREALEGALSS